MRVHYSSLIVEITPPTVAVNNTRNGCDWVQVKRNYSSCNIPYRIMSKIHLCIYVCEMQWSLHFKPILQTWKIYAVLYCKWA